MSKDPERAFRILTGLLGALIFGTRAYYQHKAGAVTKTVSERDRQDRSPRALPTYANLPGLLYILTPWVDWAHLPLPGWLRWLGALLAYAGAGVFVWTHQALGVNWSGKLELAEQHALVTHGLYRYVRHPMYTGFFLTAIGNLLLTANWLIGLPPLLANLWMYMARVQAEEAMMAERFGDAYREYMKRTGRLWPSPACLARADADVSAETSISPWRDAPR